MRNEGIDPEKLKGLKAVNYEKVSLDSRVNSKGYQVRGITEKISGGRSIGRGLGVFIEEGDASEYCELIREKKFEEAAELENVFMI